MARSLAILRVLRLSISRDQKSIVPLTGNTFFIVVLFVTQDSGLFLYLLIASVLILPLSTDPMQKIPYTRIGSWPLSTRDRIVLRLSSPWVNPMTWLFVCIVIWASLGKVTIGVASLLGALIMAGFLLSSSPRLVTTLLWKYAPALPGRYRLLWRKEMRHILTSLDWHLALFLSVSTAMARLIGISMPPSGLVILSVLLILSVLNYTQSLFANDGSSGLSRFAILPITGRIVLAIKNLSIMSVASVLLLPMNVPVGISALSVLLSISRKASIEDRRFVQMWRFSPGISFLPKGLA